MVGVCEGMDVIMTIFEFSRKVVGKPYKLCSPDGYDCLSLVREYLEAQGVEFPAEYAGYSTTQYDFLYIKHPGRAMLLFQSLLDDILKEKKVSEIETGDVLWLKSERGQFPGILAGNSSVLVVLDTGVALAPLHGYEIRKAWRVS